MTPNEHRYLKAQSRPGPILKPTGSSTRQPRLIKPHNPLTPKPHTRVLWLPPAEFDHRLRVGKRIWELDEAERNQLESTRFPVVLDLDQGKRRWLQHGEGGPGCSPQKRHLRRRSRAKFSRGSKLSRSSTWTDHHRSSSSSSSSKRQMIDEKRPQVHSPAGGGHN